MNSFSFDSLFNSSLVDAVALYIYNISAFISESLVKQEHTLIVFETASQLLQFDDFQWTLLKGFSLCLLINLILICVAWKLFGDNICERFMKPATSKAIEDLKASVSRLKLPKEHTPRV